MDLHQDTEPSQSRLWDTEETAEYLNMSPSWVEKNRDRIPHLKIGRRVLYIPASIMAFAKAREQCAA